MAKVYVIGPGGAHDYAPAREFGELVDVLDAKVNPFRTNELCRQVQAVMDDVGPEDYVLPGGSATLNAVAIAFVFSRLGQVRLLVYGAKNHDYVARDFGADWSAEPPATFNPDDARELAGAPH